MDSAQDSKNPGETGSFMFSPSELQNALQQTLE
eukprot:CAMPEP_0170492986 /NCGR_PEP_ID=MMETSP0208-20121228/13187_1 /TAXON_ID=197538 /ORGANISM="Strombidium inclinatum, Strain S3" /LENGTH=32 /DNA_ID= /DNA_START= /DNA_END= /DNA_ORIENTATION=